MPTYPSIEIGRTPNGQQKQTITQKSVSRRHARLTRVSDDQYEIEDLGSKYGTTVNGLPVVRTRVGLDTPIMLADFATTVRQLLGMPPKSTTNATAGTENTTVVNVKHLEKVYADYQQAMKALVKKRGRAQIMRMLPMQLIMPLGIGIPSIFIRNNEARTLVTSCTMVGAMALNVLLSVRMLSLADNQTDEQFDLNQQFQIDYVCPHCKNFMGAAKPYKALLNQGKCPYCKSRFSETGI